MKARHLRSGHMRSGHMRSGHMHTKKHKRSGHKRSGHKRSGHKRSGYNHRRTFRHRRYHGGIKPSGLHIVVNAGEEEEATSSKRTRKLKKKKERSMFSTSKKIKHPRLHALAEGAKAELAEKKKTKATVAEAIERVKSLQGPSKGKRSPDKDVTSYFSNKKNEANMQRFAQLETPSGSHSRSGMSVSKLAPMLPFEEKEPTIKKMTPTEEREMKKKLKEAILKLAALEEEDEV